MRRPRLTSKRIKGLLVLAEAYEQVMFKGCTASERKVAKAAAKWAHDLNAWSKARKVSSS